MSCKLKRSGTIQLVISRKYQNIGISIADGRESKFMMWTVSTSGKKNISFQATTAPIQTMTLLVKDLHISARQY